MTASAAMAHATPAASTRLVSGVLLEPLDVLFFRDGRPFGAGTRGESQQIAWPQTLAGAVWAALLEQHDCHFPELAARIRDRRQSFEEALGQMGLPAWIARVAVRGPWLARVDRRDPTNAPPEVFVPVPAVLYRLKHSSGGGQSGLRRAQPLTPDRAPPGWNKTPSGRRRQLRPLWLAEPGSAERATGWVNLHTLAKFLAGQPLRDEDLLPAERAGELFELDHRTGIGIDPGQLTARESLIYTASFLALRRHDPQGRQVVFYAEIIWPEDAAAGTRKNLHALRLGGEGRRVAVYHMDHPVSWPNVPPGSRENALLVLTTPGVFASGWKPAALADRLVAAAVPGSLPVSGWDLARGGPKPARFAAPAGSVFYLDGPADDLPQPLADTATDRQQGWGCYVVGQWSEP